MSVSGKIIDSFVASIKRATVTAFTEHNKMLAAHIASTLKLSTEDVLAAINSFNPEDAVYSDSVAEVKTIISNADLAVASSEIIIDVNYTEKCAAIFGDTKNVKDVLKSARCKFNSNLKHGAGWILPVKQLDTLREALRKNNVSFVEKTDAEMNAPTKMDVSGYETTEERPLPKENLVDTASEAPPAKMAKPRARRTVKTVSMATPSVEEISEAKGKSKPATKPRVPASPSGIEVKKVLPKSLKFPGYCEVVGLVDDVVFLAKKNAGGVKVVGVAGDDGEMGDVPDEHVAVLKENGYVL